MDPIARRNLLSTRPDPDPRSDHLVTLAGHIVGSRLGRVRVELRYVPDKLLLEAQDFGRYLEAMGHAVWETPEDLALALLDDARNEVVPRWIQVTASCEEAASAAVDAHSILVEDRQPRWDNPALLSRLKRW